MAKASSLADSLGKHLECAVCLEQYTDPKVLPCLHSFCKRCLQGLLIYEGAVWKISCPSCRSSAEVPQGQIDLLPVNFFVNNLLSVVSLHDNSKSCNLECDVCDSGDPPVNRCTTCSHFLCEFCTQGHQRGRTTRSHSMMSLEEAKKMGSVAVTKPSLCKEHDGEVMKLFCETCEEAICRDCTIVKHRDHKYTFVKDAFSKGKESLLEIVSETKTKAPVLKEAVDGVLEMKRNVHSCAEQTVQEVVNCFNELTACLDARRGELINKVEEFKKAKLKSLEIQQEELETALVSVQSSVEFTERAFENGSEVEILNMRKQMSSRLQDLNSATWQLKPCVNIGLKFKGDNQLKHGIVTFGDVTDVVTHAGMSTVTMENGQEGVMYNTLCGQPIEFTVITKEWNGKTRREGGDVFSILIDSIKLNEDPALQLKARDCGNGSYIFCHTPVQGGHYKLSVQLNGCHVKGSPFTLRVEKWNLLPFSSDNRQGQLQLSEENLTAQSMVNNDPYDYDGNYYYATDYDADYGGMQHDHNQVHRYNQYGGFQRQPDPMYRYVEQNNTIAVGSVGFVNGKHMWKVQIYGNTSQNFRFGIINTTRTTDGQLAKLGGKWMWGSNQKHYPLSNKKKKKKNLLSSGDQQAAKSNITNCASGDIMELYLDCEDGKLRMYNPRTKQSDSWDGVKEEVSPMFHMATYQDKVSLKIQQKA